MGFLTISIVVALLTIHFIPKFVHTTRTMQRARLLNPLLNPQHDACTQITGMRFATSQARSHYHGLRSHRDLAAATQATRSGRRAFHSLDPNVIFTRCVVCDTTSRLFPWTHLDGRQKNIFRTEVWYYIYKFKVHGSVICGVFIFYKRSRFITVLFASFFTFPQDLGVLRAPSTPLNKTEPRCATHQCSPLVPVCSVAHRPRDSPTVDDRSCRGLYTDCGLMRRLCRRGYLASFHTLHATG